MPLFDYGKTQGFLARRRGRSKSDAERVLQIQSGEQPRILPLFKAANAAADSKGSAKPDLQDVVFFAGGPVWGLDWRHSPLDGEGQEAATQYLAVRHALIACAKTLMPP